MLTVHFKRFLNPGFPQQNNLICKDLNQIQGLFKTTSKIQDLFKIVRTMQKVDNGATLGEENTPNWLTRNVTSFLKDLIRTRKICY